jgi:geranylgeranyl pyrophosphate synthase
MSVGASVDLAAQLAAWREAVDAELGSIWRAAPPHLAGLVEAIEYSLLGGGKRVRPVLVLAAAEACGVDTARAVPIAASFELVHAYSLVHDDLPCMDDDDLRRGRATNHKVFGEGVAVLVGDALQTEAFARIAAADGVDAATRAELVGVLARAAGWHGMAGGQYVDLQGGPHQTEASLRQLHDLKTGALIAGAVEAGAVLGGVDAATRALFATFGRELGWLFQVVDDLLDEVGSAGVTGKTAGTDARHGKVTATGVFDGPDGVAQAADAQVARCIELCASLPAAGGALPAIARYIRDRDH